MCVGVGVWWAGCVVWVWMGCEAGVRVVCVRVQVLRMFVVISCFCLIQR